MFTFLHIDNLPAAPMPEVQGLSPALGAFSSLHHHLLVLSHPVMVETLTRFAWVELLHPRCLEIQTIKPFEGSRVNIIRDCGGDIYLRMIIQGLG